MKAHELRTLLPALLSEADTALGIATTAENSKQSLAGTGRYADRFHDALVRITTVEKKIRPHLGGLQLSTDDTTKFDTSLDIIKATTGKLKTRTHCVRDLKLLCETTILPKLESLTASSIPSTESVLPMDVVRGTRGYFEDVVTQINGCYEHQWYDACSVMIRKLAESLIIAVYEKKGVSSEIKDGNDNFHMLSKLVQHIQGKRDWNLGRETKPCLDEMKKLGDRSAHNRHYVAKKPDVDGLISGLRVTVEDLLCHAGLK